VTGSDANLLARYKAGEHEAVWAELRAGAQDDALAVAQETMARVARNADRLAVYLTNIGWRVPSGEMRSPKLGADERDVIARAEDISGVEIPLALQVFWEVVGGIDFVWDYKADLDIPDIDVVQEFYDDLDPLYIDPAPAMENELDHWAYIKEDDPDEYGRFVVPLAPDHYHKANISGGAPYSVSLSENRVDPMFLYAPIEEPFTDYLRRAFRWGGFPGLEAHADVPDVRRFVEPLAAQMEPF